MLTFFLALPSRFVSLIGRRRTRNSAAYIERVRFAAIGTAEINESRVPVRKICTAPKTGRHPKNNSMNPEKGQKILPDR